MFFNFFLFSSHVENVSYFTYEAHIHTIQFQNKRQPQLLQFLVDQR